MNTFIAHFYVMLKFMEWVSFNMERESLYDASTGVLLELHYSLTLIYRDVGFPPTNTYYFDQNYKIMDGSLLG